jgi:hypothetical protein
VIAPALFNKPRAIKHVVGVQLGIGVLEAMIGVGDHHHCSALGDRFGNVRHDPRVGA